MLTSPREQRDITESYRLCVNLQDRADRAFPIVNKAGRVDGIAGVAEDITERKQVRKGSPE